MLKSSTVELGDEIPVQGLRVKLIAGDPLECIECEATIVPGQTFVRVKAGKALIDLCEACCAE